MRRGGAHRRDEVVVTNASLRAVAVAIVVVVVVGGGGGERRDVTSRARFRLTLDFLCFLGPTERIEVRVKTMYRVLGDGV